MRVCRRVLHCACERAYRKVVGTLAQARLVKLRDTSMTVHQFQQLRSRDFESMNVDEILFPLFTVVDDMKRKA